MTLMTDGHYKVLHRGSGEKVYRAGFIFNGMPKWSKGSGGAFRTATQAREYGERVLARWRRMRDYALAAEQRPHKTEEF